jgi:hypothetical protein
MKKLAVLLALLISLLPLRVQAESVNWIALQSDTTTITAPGQSIQLSLTGALNTPINGAALILSYDPACFRIANHQPGSLIPEATAFVQGQPGKLDLTYFYQGQGKGLTGEGTLIDIQLEALQLCASDVSVTPETITLGVLNEQGMAFNLTGVEYRGLTAHIVPSAGLPVVTPQPVVAVPEVEVPSVLPAPEYAVAPARPTFSISPYIIFMPILAIPLLSAAVYFLTRRPVRKPGITAPVLGSGPVLILAGRSIPIQQERTALGRYTHIVRRSGIFYITDSGSLKGTYVNGKRIESGYHRINTGDQIQLGEDTTYRFVENLRRPLRSS